VWCSVSDNIYILTSSLKMTFLFNQFQHFPHAIACCQLTENDERKWMLCCFLSLFLFCCFSYFQYQFMIQWCNYLSSNAIKWRKSSQYLDVRSRYLLPFDVYCKSIPVHLQIQTCLLYRWLMSFLMFDKVIILSYIILYFVKTKHRVH
jgi:hypothetical protein